MSAPSVEFVRVGGAGTLPSSAPNVQFVRVGGAGTLGVAPKVQLIRVGGAGVSAVAVRPFAPFTVDPMVQQVTTVTGQLTDGTTADSWSIRRISGATAVLTPAGAAVSFPTPAVLAGTSIVLGFTATKGGVTSSEATVTVTCLPQLKFVLDANRQWAPDWSIDITAG